MAGDRVSDACQVVLAQRVLIRFNLSVQDVNGSCSDLATLCKRARLCAY